MRISSPLCLGNLQTRMVGDDAGAREHSVPLAAATAGRAEDGAPQLETLLLLRQDRPASDAFERARPGDRPASDLGMSGALLWHLGACAACRLGRVEEGRRRWQEALKIEPGLAIARANLDTVGGTSIGLPEVVPPLHAFPAAWTSPGGKGDAVRAEDPGASSAFLEAAYLAGDGRLRALVRSLLKQRASRSDAEAVRLLREFARLPVGSFGDRHKALAFLREQGLIGRVETVEIWDGVRLRSVKLLGTEICREPKESGLPADLDQRLLASIDALKAGRLGETESRLDAIHRSHPRPPDRPDQPRRGAQPPGSGR